MTPVVASVATTDCAGCMPRGWFQRSARSCSHNRHALISTQSSQRVFLVDVYLDGKSRLHRSRGWRWQRRPMGCGSRCGISKRKFRQPALGFRNHLLEEAAEVGVHGADAFSPLVVGPGLISSLTSRQGLLDAACVCLCQFAGGQVKVCGPFAFGPILLDVPQDLREPLMLALSVPVRVHGEGDGCGDLCQSVLHSTTKLWMTGHQHVNAWTSCRELELNTAIERNNGGGLAVPCTCIGAALRHMTNGRGVRVGDSPRGQREVDQSGRSLEVRNHFEPINRVTW